MSAIAAASTLCVVLRSMQPLQGIFPLAICRLAYRQDLASVK